MSVDDGDYLSCDASFTLGDGTIAQNRFRFLADFSVGSEDDQDVLDGLESRMETMYATINSKVSNEVTPNLFTVSELEWSIADTQWLKTRELGTFTPTITFINAGDALPNQCAPFVTAKTLRPRTVGRKFVLPFCEDQQNEGVLSAGAVTQLTSWASYYIAAITISAGNNLRPGVVREGVQGWNTFTAVVVSDIIGTQRRRMPGRGI